MPKVPTYQRQSLSVSIPDVRAQAPDASAFGGSVGAAMGNVGQAIVQAGDEINNQLIERQQKINTQKVLDLSTKLDADLAKDINNGYLTLKGQDAFGMDKDASKHIDNIFKKYIDMADNDVQRLAFSQYALPRIQKYKNLVTEHVNQQIDIATDQAYTAQEISSKESAIANRNHPELFLTNITTGLQARENRLRRKGTAPEAIAAEGLAYTSDILKGAAQAFINDGDIDGAQRLTKTYSDKLLPSDKSEIEGKLRPLIENNEDSILVRDLAKKYDLTTVEGQRAFKAEIERLRGPDSTKTITIPGQGSLSWEETKELVGKKESSGNYDAHNNDSGAHGKYQFMPDTWKGIMGDAPMTPENQEKAFETKYKPIYDKYGAAGVLVAVYAGDSNAERYMNGEDLIGDNGKPYSADAPQYSNGREYPSVRQYVINALGNDGRQAGTTTKTVPAFDAVRYNRVVAMADNLIAQAVSEKNRAEHEVYTRLLDDLAVNKGDLQTQLTLIQTSGLRPSVIEDLTQKVTAPYQKEKSKSANGALEILSASDQLTTSAVDAVKDQLSWEDYLKWKARATKQQKTEAEKANDNADKQWHTWVKSELFPGNVSMQNEYIADLKAFLDAEGVNGGDRTVKARQYIDNQKKDVGYILGYRSRNATGFSQIDEAYPVIGGPSVSSLILKGDPNADAVGWMKIINEFLQDGDPDAQYAWDFIINNRLALTEKALWDIRNEHARANGRL